MKFRILLLTSLQVIAVAGFSEMPQAENNAPIEDQDKERRVRVAAISYVPTKFDLHKNADTLEQSFREANAGGAKIAVAPEGALDGFVFNEIIKGRRAPDEIHKVAVTIDDPVIKRFQILAKELEMCLVFGLAEKVGNEVYNCAVFIDDQGILCGKQHKMQVSVGSHPDWWFSRLGNECRAFDTPYGRCGIMICHDRWNPQLAKIHALDGAQFLAIPSYGSTSQAQDEEVLKRGKENNVPVIEANVGVTMIVDDNQIIALDRKEVGITFGEITIPARHGVNEAERQKIQEEFLKWRDEEMKVRYDKLMKSGK